MINYQRHESLIMMIARELTKMKITSSNIIHRIFNFIDCVGFRLQITCELFFQKSVYI